MLEGSGSFSTGNLNAYWAKDECWGGEVGKANGVDGSYGHHSASFPFASGRI